jgi:hypothetical protein
MKIELIKHWNNPNESVAMTAYNIGMIRFAAETQKIQYILSKIDELYKSAKNDGITENGWVSSSKRLIDDVVHKLLRLGSYDSDFYGWPTVYGPRTDGHIPNITDIKIERKHLIKALTPTRYV